MPTPPTYSPAIFMWLDFHYLKGLFGGTDRPHPGSNNVKLVKSVNQENDGYEEEQIPAVLVTDLITAFDDKADFWQLKFLALQRTFSAGSLGGHAAIAVSRQRNSSPGFPIPWCH